MSAVAPELTAGTTGLLLTVFGASVTGSLHCVGMCGPLMACAVATPGSANGKAATLKAATLGPGFGMSAKRDALRNAATHAGYHASRGVGYAVLGGVAGGVGALLDLTGTLAGAVPIAGVLAGLCLIVIALTVLSHALGWRLGSRQHDSASAHVFRRMLLALQHKAFALPPTLRATVIGTLTPLLPCGWLYAFALVAAGTGSVTLGVAVMAAFWLGTLPALLAIGVGLQGTLAALRRRAPKLTAWATAAAMLFIGVTLLTGRLGLDPAQLALATETRAAQRAPGQVTPNGDETPACCPLMEAAAQRSEADAP
ncbi:MAG: sulfite exporter TauE/SafE family protein [Planctomycetota bacterium]